MKTYTKTHTVKKALEAHKKKLKQRGANVTQSGMTLKYDWGGKSEREMILHEVAEAIRKVKGINQVQYFIEEPNRYGDNVGEIIWRWPGKDKYNYRGGGVKIRFDDNMAHLIPLTDGGQGLYSMKSISKSSILQIIRQHYKPWAKAGFKI